MSPSNRTHMGGTRESFLTTQWSLIEGIQQGQDKDQALIGSLLERYWKPVYCYLRCKGHQNEDAKDLTQGFLHEIVLNRGLIQRADASKGRFRSFLLHALNQFVIDQNRRASTQKRIPKDKLVPFDMDNPPELPQSLLESSPEDGFTYAWKSDLLDRTLEEVRAECERRGQSMHWSLFHDKVLGPTFYDEADEPMKEICQRHGVESETRAFNMLLTVKRRFKAALRQNLANTVTTEDDIDEEWRDLYGLFGKNAKNAG